MIEDIATIKVAVQHGVLRLVKNISPTTQSVASVQVSFEFPESSEWDRLIKTAVFQRGDLAYSQPLESDGSCIIPWEILDVEQVHGDTFFSIGLLGIAEGIRLPTNKLRLKIQQGCYVDGEQSQSPTPTIYEQLQMRIDALNDYSKEEILQFIAEYCEDNNIATEDEIENISIIKRNKFTIQKLQDYLYYIDYDEFDYENGEAYFLERYNPDFGTCSSVRKGNFYGRNYDWHYDDKASFIINKKATKGRYASIGVAGGIISNDIANGGEYNELYEYLPFLTLDGINEKGVVCNINVLPELDKKGVTTGTNPGKPNVPMVCLVRRILDEASSADDAIYKIQHDYNIIAPSREDIAMEMHFMIADKDKTYVVEFVNNTPIIIDEFVDNKPIMTNFYLNDYDGTRASLTPYAMGIERYVILSEGFDAVNSQQDMADLMRSVLYSKAYSADENPVWCSEFAGQYNSFGTLTKDSSLEDYAPLLEYVREMFEARERDGSTWQTVHCSVYDIAEKKLWISVQEDEKVYEIRFDVLGEKERVIDVSGQIGEHNVDANAHANLFDSKADKIDNTVISNNTDYAEILQWYDNNPNAENRLCRFVQLDAGTPGNTIKIASQNSEIIGVTVEYPAFAGGALNKFDSDGNLLPQYEFVAVHGIVPIIDNGTCTVKGRCMPAADGTAIPSTNDMGYFCMERVDANHMLIVVEPNADMLKHIKDDINGKQNTLVSGTNIKTINGNSILGSGNIEIQVGTFEWSEIQNTPTSIDGYGITDAYTKAEIEELIDTEINEIDEAPNRSKYYPYEIHNLLRRGKMFTYNGHPLIPSSVISDMDLPSSYPGTFEFLMPLSNSQSSPPSYYTFYIASNKGITISSIPDFHMFADADKTKLALIEDRADKTDSDNVKSAGAVMGVRVDEIELVKDSNGKVNISLDNKQDTISDLDDIREGALLGLTSIQESQKGVSGGVAELDDSGKILSSQLPSYVDDVLEYNATSDFPLPGENGKIYIAKDTNKTYRWSGTTYVEIAGGVTLGETSSTAYRGDRGKTAYEHSQTVTGNPHNVTKTDVGLGNVNNTSDADKPISTATEAALLNKADISTTLAGYGIADAYTKTEVDAELAKKQDKIIIIERDGSYCNYSSSELNDMIDDGKIILYNNIHYRRTSYAGPNIHFRAIGISGNLLGFRVSSDKSFVDESLNSYYELTNNRKSNLNNPDNNTYPTTQAVVDYVATQIVDIPEATTNGQVMMVVDGEWAEGTVECSLTNEQVEDILTQVFGGNYQLPPPSFNNLSFPTQGGDSNV